MLCCKWTTPRAHARSNRSSCNPSRFRCRASGPSGPLDGAQEPDTAQPSPQAAASQIPLSSAISRSLTELSKGSNRLSNSTNLLLCGESEETWRRLDSKVNKYPIQRSFTAIGTGGQDFRAAMVAAVESVVGSVHTECISERHSSGRNYISVTVGPVWVENGDQAGGLPSVMGRAASMSISHGSS
ncbi:hypothetical protein VOLCADRAFT_105282 [Volvox carteri f. nagariensis]|uniref:Uncharacterized protein n=1 Tax=Volvox carteri f. nagariensis TaxID=3068 RepID=D8TZR6_VOLCA|nr:uncharacterized protein VOLCADRAFT_105282 [Volvox carteri f. nagariensis]EFJ46969.1 hypothetical protein VOLCADRAFT_105282 [Volvox carteri f. nagariensis]|eukprot:XP_002951864.1 hypothetical protein VOLCADRAFT_105282 [Volvox carteri f. nagariensis]